MVVQAISVHIKVHLLPIRLVDSKDALVAVSIVCHFKFVVDQLQRQYISNSPLIKPDLTVILHIGLQVGGERTTIAADGHGLLHVPNACDQLLIAEKIHHQLIIKEDAIVELGPLLAHSPDVTKVKPIGILIIRVIVMVIALGQSNLLVILTLSFLFFLSMTC